MTPLPLISSAAAGEVFTRWAAWQGLTLFCWHGARPSRSWLYFAEIEGRGVKVGWSHNPLARIRVLHSDYFCSSAEAQARPLVLIADGGFVLEQYLLAFLRMRERLVRGNEWFQKSAALDGLVSALMNQAEACFFDNRVAGYQRVSRNCSVCRQPGHNCGTCPDLAPQRDARARQAVAAMKARHQIEAA